VRSFVSAVATLPAFAALAILQTWPLARHLDTHLPGLGLGDNVSFAWNVWWMREALTSADWNFFSTPLLMAPLGAPLVLHTHTAALAWIGATVLSPLTVVAAQNVLLIASIALNGWSVSLLTYVLTGHRPASFLAGLMLLASPVIATRLMGHYNLVAVWPLVFACLAFLVWWRHSDRASGIGLGIAAGLLPLFDYYLSVYFLIFVIVYCMAAVVRLDVTRTRGQSRLIPIVGVALAMVAVCVAAVIAITSTDALVVMGVRVSARSPTNALTVAWLAGLVAMFARWRWHVGYRIVWPRQPRDVARSTILPFVVALVVLTPLIFPAWHLWQSGGYVTQQAGLRSGPRGVDVGTLIIGPPFHGLAGATVRDGYRQFEIDPIEGSAYVGWVPLVFASWAWRGRRDVPTVREWGAVFAVFAVMALGPYLMVFGRNTGLLLPAAALRLIPVVNNARIPGRALLVVAMAAAVLSTFACRSLWARSTFMAGGLVAVLIVGESLAAPLALTALPSVGVYARVASDPTPAAVLTVPFGVRDGFGELGRVEPDAILQQTRHRHPIAGGFVARLPPSIPAWYEANEPFATLLRLSAGRGEPSLPSCEKSRSGLESANVGWVVVYADASEPLRQWLTTLPIETVETDGQRTLYRVTRC